MKPGPLYRSLMAMLALAAPLAGQEAPADSAGRPFVEGGAYDKPFLTRLAGRTAIGGYAEAHARWARADPSHSLPGPIARRAYRA